VEQMMDCSVIMGQVLLITPFRVRKLRREVSERQAFTRNNRRGSFYRARINLESGGRPWWEMYGNVCAVQVVHRLEKILAVSLSLRSNQLATHRFGA